ncbi:hypothetical protein J2X46_001769 [Nocardioides sp. BE266]|uniref:hypothetical protein n=1 Tax=Nocardioides sp. BE266 TaxID=2817725 RepID=UPI002859EB06|nr:hypothetical protein [Nocardioides sp. BE266]MDR7252784.1 hypothetical protein [Nocardioides sp. BE266]
MRMRVGALVIGLAAALAACSSSTGSAGPDDSGEPSPSTATPTVETPDVDFTATLTPGGDELVIEWSLRNRSADEVLVTNRVPDSYGRLSDRPDTAYVVAAADGGTEIAKRVFPVSSDAGGDGLPWIGVTPLAPGDTLEEKLRVPLPMAAYAPPTVDAGDVPASGRVVFCAGVLVGRDPSWGFHDVDGVTTVNHGRSAAGQATFCSDPVEVG